MKPITLNREHREIHNIDDLLSNGFSLRNATIQGIDFKSLKIAWSSFDLHGSVFLGCKFSNDGYQAILSGGGIIFPEVLGLPYQKYRSALYTWEELYQEDDSGISKDLTIYTHFSDSKYNPSLVESLCQRHHDHAIDDALRDLLLPHEDGSYKTKSIGVMGGHGTSRADEFYSKTAFIAQKLASKDYFIVSGGGPGIMEAANLGAYFSNYEVSDLKSAIDILKTSPKYTDDLYHESALKVLDLYPKGNKSLAIPTWFYGHEPSNVFASQIAKYFSNSIREDILLAICLHGILFAPGSAGTTQEIFMDAAQNHYCTFGFYSPMIFLGTKRYQKETNIYGTLCELAKNTGYHSLIQISDDIDEIVNLFVSNPPIRKS